MYNAKMLVFVIASGFSLLATAAPVTFNFTEGFFSASQRTFSSANNLHKLTARASSDFEYARLRVWRLADSSNTRSGIGVFSCPSPPCSDLGQIDHEGASETLTFDFGKQVKILTATFNVQKQFIDQNQFSLMVDGIKSISNENIGTGETLRGTNNQSVAAVFDFGKSLTGSQFSFLSQENVFSRYTLLDLSVEYIATPEPTTFVLLSLGLVALVRLRQREA